MTERSARRTAAVEETERLGELLAPALEVGDVLALCGPLGAGKTRFVAGLARGLAAAARVRSPTYTLVNEYHGRLALAHLDLYRVEAPDMESLGIEEYLERGVLAVEWGERLPVPFRADGLSLSFALRSATEREIVAAATGARGAALLRAWEALPDPARGHADASSLPGAAMNATSSHRAVGLAVEAATEHVEVLVRTDAGERLAHEVEEIGHGHTRRLTPLVARALERAAVRPDQLAWVAADLGPGSFTGVRVGLATAEALALAAGVDVLGASSLAALALASGTQRALVVPLVPAGRRDLYAGFYRADRHGVVRLLSAPTVGPPERVLAAVAESHALLGAVPVRFIGPGAAREQALLERAHAGSTTPPVRFAGLSALDLAEAVCSRRGPQAGLPARGEALRPCYVRSAQAEERVRRAALAGHPVLLRPMDPSDVPRIAAIEREVFSDPWPESFFLHELSQPLTYARVAEQDGELAGYCVAWLGAGTGHLGNLAVVPGRRRRGVARRMVEDLLARAPAQGAEGVTLEVRVSNFAAQGLYQAHGFRLAGLRRGYYRDTGEDALVMMWRAPAAFGDRGAHPGAPETHSTLP